jgi:hypothetical protein
MIFISKQASQEDFTVASDMTLSCLLILSKHDNEDQFDVRDSRKEGHDHAELFDQAAVQRMVEM